MNPGNKAADEHWVISRVYGIKTVVKEPPKTRNQGEHLRLSVGKSEVIRQRRRAEQKQTDTPNDQHQLKSARPQIVLGWYVK